MAAGALSPEAAVRLDGMAGLRNILVHDYVAIEEPRIWDVLDQQLDDLRNVHQALGRLPELSGSGERA